ncbi:hypothetical protein CEXT_804761 [Caerostris extrusa]|uniref:Uncharacterized protein n=1 Tax=Caerostris extrusa TaxID=172846 RepID=A0AAV4RRU7_CAEEX|nr:hypothetical protein CEXT_804761 [Caerostris extrusa]
MFDSHTLPMPDISKTAPFRCDPALLSLPGQSAPEVHPEVISGHPGETRRKEGGRVYGDRLGGRKRCWRHLVKIAAEEKRPTNLFSLIPGMDMEDPLPSSELSTFDPGIEALSANLFRPNNL